MISKVCCTCKLDKDISNFNKNKSTKDGYQKQCNDCRRLTQIKFRNESTGKKVSEKYRKSEQGKETVKKNIQKYRQTEKYVDSWKKSSKKNRINTSMSARVRQSLKGCKYRRHWEDIVGYTLNELKTHLENRFSGDMTWDNHGMFGWHIDHIRPITSFNITSYQDEDFKRCWSLDNLQPLWWKDNLIKGGKYEI